MFRFIQQAEELFGSLQSCYEAVFEVNAEFETTVQKLPAYNVLAAFAGNCSEWDSMEILIQAAEEFQYRTDSAEDGAEAYQAFLQENEPEDTVTVRIMIRKKGDSVISVYSLQHFLTFIDQQEQVSLLRMFSGLLQDKSIISFSVLDEDIQIDTKTIAFTSGKAAGTPKAYDRKSALENRYGASQFLNRHELPLLPEDFRVSDPSAGNGLLVKAFGRLETILACIYISNSAYIVKNKLVLEFGSGAKGLEFDLESFERQEHICALYRWIFDSETAVERAGIARNIIGMNCHTPEQIKNVDDNLLGAIRSGFMIYQRSAIDGYIETKNKIADYLVETSKQIQEITHGLADGLRNNFMAVIMFLITVILTDSMDFENIAGGSIPENIVWLFHLFCAASFFYLVASFWATFRKWQYCKAGYQQLKRHYGELLDEEDLKRAFGNDEAWKKDRKALWTDVIVITILWLLFIVIMLFLFKTNGNRPVMPLSDMIQQRYN